MQHPSVTDIADGSCNYNYKTCICVLFIMLVVSWAVAVFVAHTEGCRYPVAMSVALFAPLCTLIVFVRCVYIFGCICATPSHEQRIQSKIVRNFQSILDYEKNQKILFSRLVGIIHTTTYDFYIYEFGQNCKIEHSIQRRKDENLKWHLVFISNLTQLHSIRCPGSLGYTQRSNVAAKEHFDIIVEYYNENNNKDDAKTTPATLNRYSVTREQANTHIDLCSF